MEPQVDNGVNATSQTTVESVLVTAHDRKEDTTTRFVGAVENGQLKLDRVDESTQAAMRQDGVTTQDIGRLPSAPDWIDRWDAYDFPIGQECQSISGYPEHYFAGGTIDATKPLSVVGGAAVGGAFGTLVGSIVGPEGSTAGAAFGGFIGGAVGGLISMGYDTETATIAAVDQDIGGYGAYAPAIRYQYSGYWNDRDADGMIPTAVKPDSHIFIPNP
ncbi:MULTISPECIES: glycine zipper domain-containing protein [Haloarcula]|uniref:glycine zipper domain-containing protein n=1 Tax=Haloarcula TaxID=2237 RepID=UPI0016653A95|nr:MULTISPECIES: glycine zipper domain-containing protein [Halomicroarcula]MBX0349174.1 hypothetical protein [Halomicroarcula pellucida]MDS0279233.1 hypothetical protein [Halomicroarcula sp. S1AR25-4]